MDSFDLFKQIKKEMETLQIKKFIGQNNNSQDDTKPGSLRYINNFMSRYNLENYFEIIKSTDVDCLEEINSGLLGEFTDCIETYMDENAPGQIEFKQYIKLISIYLVFISKKPLHPLGMIMLGEDKIIEKEGVFYCPLKKHQINDKSSLCIYCVCREGFEADVSHGK